MLAVFLVLLIARAVIGYLMMLPNFRPTGAVAVIFELVFTVTDPVLRPLDRVLPPVHLGRAAISLSFPVVFIAVTILMGVAGQL